MIKLICNVVTMRRETKVAVKGKTIVECYGIIYKYYGFNKKGDPIMLKIEELSTEEVK